jgi:quinol monooxygenase YgiN
MIHVLAMITAKAGMRDAILKEFHANMPAVHAEKGCIEYGPAVDAEGIGNFQTKFGPDSFVVIEKWESADALKAHAASPHMAAYGAKTRDMIASRVIHVLSPSGASQRPAAESRLGGSARAQFSTAADEISTDHSS